MNTKQFFTAHGEKVAVSLTLLACAAQLAMTFSDASIRPNEVSTQVIAEKNTLIEGVFSQGKPPLMKPVPSYLARMESRFNQPVANVSVPSWLTIPPDRGPGEGGLVLYVYEVPAPTISAVDTVGTVELSIGLPASIRSNGRLRDGNDVAWDNSGGRGNRATQVGLFVETTHGDNRWLPLTGPGLVDGYIDLATLNAAGGKIVIKQLEPWMRHTFRARIVAKATGLAVGNGVPGRTASGVLVVPGRIAGEKEDLSWPTLTDQIRNRDQKTLGRFAAPYDKPVPGLTMGADEQAYLGGQSDEASVLATSDIRFAVIRTNEGTGGSPDGVTLLLTKMFVGKDGTRLWLPEPQVVKKNVEEEISTTVATQLPTVSSTSKVTIKLTTPFVIKQVKRNEKRTIYYEIREKSKANGKGKELEAVPVVQPTDLVIVGNPKTNASITMMKLGKLKHPNRADAITTPKLPEELDEEASFRKDPAGFVQMDLTPPAPKRHPANEGPLVAVRNQHQDLADLYTTDTDYFELPDGRLVWWEPLNRHIRQYPDPQAATPAPAEAPNATPQSTQAPAPTGTTQPGPSHTAAPATPATVPVNANPGTRTVPGNTPNPPVRQPTPKP